MGETLLDQVTDCIDAAFSRTTRRLPAHRSASRRRMPIAAIVQVMVYGNRSDECASGVPEPDIQTGEGPCVATYLVNAQGPQVVGSANVVQPRSLIDMKADWSDVHHELCRISDAFDAAFPQVQEVEFTVDDRRVWSLQARDASLSPLASLRYAAARSTQVIGRRPRPLCTRVQTSCRGWRGTSCRHRWIRRRPSLPGSPRPPASRRSSRRRTRRSGWLTLAGQRILIGSRLTPQDDFDLIKRLRRFRVDTWWSRYAYRLLLRQPG